MTRIFIIGYMGVGKTTVGNELGKKLGIEFIDLDKYIQNKYRKSVQDLFKEKGETGFRELERSALIEVADFEEVIISTGGGAPCFYDNMDLMNSKGITVYIHAEPEELASRLQASKNVRPLIDGKKDDVLIAFITNHLKERESYYNKAQIIVNTNHLVTLEHVSITVDQIIDKLNEK